MALRTKLLAATAIALSLTGLTAASAAAATDPLPKSVIRIDGPRGQLAGLQSTDLGSFKCPSDHPYMWNRALAPGRSVPEGTEVHEPGSIGVTMDQFREVLGPDGNGYLAGHTDVLSSATNWDLSTHDYAIVYYCTSDTGQALPDDNGVL
jgi:hypothetical protein